MQANATSTTTDVTTSLEGGRNLVLCLDGTSNEPETGMTNVARLFEIAAKDEYQRVFYHPGVGTMGARGATTQVGQALTRLAGLALGYGVQANIEEAYRFLVREYTPGARIYIFGFSRGAYTARALAGLLRTVGLLRPEAENLVPYAMKLYSRGGAGRTSDRDREAERRYWALREHFDDSFGNPDFPNRFAPQVHYLGVWDSVKSVGWLNLKARWVQARWPFTRNIANVAHARHALALDEWRRHFEAYRFAVEATNDPKRDLREMWFRGVHSDIGGTYPDDHRLADIALRWVLDEAIDLGLRFDPDAYEAHVTVPRGVALPAEFARGAIHTHPAVWRLIGWSRRQPLPTDAVHPSVAERDAGTAA